MTLICEEEIAGPATHAIVIGVGAYVHLPGGDGEAFPDHGGLGQLTSPPHSARAFATWLLRDYTNPGKPLASLDLLVSDSESSQFTLPNGDVKEVERASYDRVKPAIRAWKGRGDESRDHFLIFFFCGHGVARGLVTSLLLDDFGELHDHPLEHAIDFRELHSGMDRCAARQQWYLIDACRKASPALIERYNNYAGDPIWPGSATHSVHGPRSAPIYYSTVPGSGAYGRTGEPSVFTEALLKALEGAGSNDLEGDWRVSTDWLYLGIRYVLRRALGEGEGLEQVSQVDGLVPFVLHYIDGRPLVPVTIGCQPAEANGAADLTYSDPGGSNPIRREPIEPSEWDVDIEEGKYVFSARFAGGRYHDNRVERHVRPPYRRVPIEVSDD
jgi:hypothetical protein